ncbi:TonB family protein [Pseudomonas sp. NPDC090202]|uniref:TonB family protein n=1 Tax=unclassified Pseudomonas TaxID=196821 RepID=UPI00381783E2
MGAEADHPLFERYVTPDYPSTLLKDRLLASVRVDYDIHHDGSVHAIRIIESTDPLVADIARSAVRQWRFKPWRVTERMPAEIRETVLFVFDQALREQGLRMLISWERRDS